MNTVSRNRAMNPNHESQPCPACGGLPPENRACEAAEVLALRGMSPGGFA